MKKGFTLIELLVVVLIIGILAAVALPQYERAVEKSKMAEALVVLRKIADNNRVYQLASGDYAVIGDDDVLFEGLSLPVSSNGNHQGKNYCYLQFFGAYAAVNGKCAQTDRADYMIMQPFTGQLKDNPSYLPPGVSEDEHLCLAVSDKGEKICKSVANRSVADGGTTYYVF